VKVDVPNGSANGSGVHVFVPRFEPGAVGHHVAEARAALVAAGHRSEIFAGDVDPAWAHRGAHHYQDYGRSVSARPGDRLVYQVAIGSPVADWLVARDEMLIANHHNFTPLRFLQAWDPAATHGVAWGRGQLGNLARRCTLGIADSRFNELDLKAAGFADTVVVPVLVDLSAFDRETDDALIARLQDAKSDGGADWLFVGRIAPNKCQHDLVAALAAHRRAYGSRARLRLVGSSTSASYSFALERFVAALGLEEAVEITGPVSPAALGAYYRAADVLVCVSEHEGFCVPLLEAMHHGVPVVAFGAGAVPETVGTGGLVLDRKDPETVATAVERVLSNDELRTALVAAGRARAAQLDPEQARAAFVAAIEQAGSR
jgi:glycosyltransferase involved in cell wall biosynthesis